MKRFICLSLIMLSVMVSGCSSAFWGGAAGGAVGTGVGYEYNAAQQLKHIEDEHNAGRMSDVEYNARKDQIQRMSITK